MKIVDAVKAELKMPNLKVVLHPVTSATRIPLMANGTIDLECGSTTNNRRSPEAGRFTNTYFVIANRYVAKKASNIKSLADLKGKTVVSTSGTTNIKWLTEENGKQNIGMNILTAKDHAEAFLMVETDRAAAFFMDDILLYSLVASSKAPARLRDRRRGATQSSRTASCCARTTRSSEGRRSTRRVGSSTSAARSTRSTRSGS